MATLELVNYEYFVPSDLYLIPSEEDSNFLLYRPSKFLVALIQPHKAYELSELLRRVKASDKTLPSRQKEFVALLAKKGFLDHRTDTTNPCASESEINCHKRDLQALFPHEVTLDITKKCNMRCIYCYACGGDSKTSMSLECGYAAISYGVANAKSKNIFFGLHFHGGGEPSQEYKKLLHFHEFAKNKCKENGIDFKCSTITNGLISSEIINFYAKNMDEITLSIDGDQLSHDQQRLNRNNGPTFDKVFNTAKQFHNLKKKLNLRTTITSKNVSRLEEIVEFLISEFPGYTINIEPVTLVGRALNKNELACDSIQFANNLFAAMEIAIKAGATLFYSGVSGHSQRKEFCAASAPNFYVCADGSVTSCFSYSNKENLRELFIYGSYDERNDKFKFDSKKISRLQTLTMDHDKYCDDCFCRTHCIGDCPAVRKFNSQDNMTDFEEVLDSNFMYNRRCTINRKIVTLLINDLVRSRISDAKMTKILF